MDRRLVSKLRPHEQRLSRGGSCNMTRIVRDKLRILMSAILHRLDSRQFEWRQYIVISQGQISAIMEDSIGCRHAGWEICAGSKLLVPFLPLFDRFESELLVFNLATIGGANDFIYVGRCDITALEV